MDYPFAVLESLWPFTRINPDGQGKYRQSNHDGRYYSIHDDLLPQDVSTLAGKETGFMAGCFYFRYFREVHLATPLSITFAITCYFKDGL